MGARRLPLSAGVEWGRALSFVSFLFLQLLQPSRLLFIHVSSLVVKIGGRPATHIYEDSNDNKDELSEV